MTNREYIEAMVKKAKAAVDQVENYDQAQTDLMFKVAAKVCWEPPPMRKPGWESSPPRLIRTVSPLLPTSG